MSLIEREAAIRTIKLWRGTISVEMAVAEIAALPTIDPAPVVHGRWIHDINNLYGCSECIKRETMSPKKLKPYCPNCGARMDGGENDAKTD